MPNNNLRVVQNALPSPIPDASASGGIANRQGIQVVQDWYTYCALLGMAYQVRAGTITTPLVGNVAIADTVAEMCVDAATAATLFIPVSFGIGVRLATGTLVEMGLKSVATVSSAGTAFTPLPLRNGGVASITSARVAAHAVTVTAELATTTLRHWEYANPVTAGAGNDPGAGLSQQWQPRVPPILIGPRCFYLQVGAATTGPSYYAHIDYIEGPAASLT